VKRWAVLLILGTLGSVVAVGGASASTASCEFKLLDLHFATVRELIDVQKDFSRQVFTFNRAAFADDTEAEIRKDFAAAAKASGTSFGEALKAIRALRDDAFRQFKSGGACSGAPEERKTQEVRYFAAQELFLDHSYARAIMILRRTLQALLSGCC
jgi:hypothetical protein